MLSKSELVLSPTIIKLDAVVDSLSRSTLGITCTIHERGESLSESCKLLVEMTSYVFDKIEMIEVEFGTKVSEFWVYLKPKTQKGRLIVPVVLAIPVLLLLIMALAILLAWLYLSKPLKGLISEFELLLSPTICKLDDIVDKLSKSALGYACTVQNLGQFFIQD